MIIVRQPLGEVFFVIEGAVIDRPSSNPNRFTHSCIDVLGGKTRDLAYNATTNGRPTDFGPDNFGLHRSR